VCEYKSNHVLAHSRRCRGDTTGSFRGRRNPVAATARERIRLEGGYRRDHLRALAQRVEVAEGEVRIMGSKSNLLRVLAANGVATAAGGVPIVVPKWRCCQSNANPSPAYALVSTSSFDRFGLNMSELNLIGHRSGRDYGKILAETLSSLTSRSALEPGIGRLLFRQCRRVHAGESPCHVPAYSPLP